MHESVHNTLAGVVHSCTSFIGKFVFLLEIGGTWVFRSPGTEFVVVGEAAV